MTLADQERRVPIENAPVVPGRFAGFDIENPGGSVRVEVSPRYAETTITAYVRHEARQRLAAAKEGWDYSHKGPWFRATYDEKAEVGTVSVRATEHTLADGTRPFVDVVVRTPVCDGLVVKSKFGEVDVRGVRGEVTIDAEGDVTLKSNKALTERVSVRTTHGDVQVVTVPGSRGTFLITTPEGQSQFSSAYGRVEDSRPRLGEWTGIWNRGSNPVTVHAERGDVVYIVKENAEMYTVQP
jgi:hypothetical protein